MTPARADGVAVRIVATSDLLGALVRARTSYGCGGTVGDVAALVARERAAGPTVWLDTGDVAGGPAVSLTGAAPWREVAGLPIDAAAAGNHEFDGGLDALATAARTLRFPLLCADRPVGLPGAMAVETPAGTLGVVGISHPSTELLAPAAPGRRADTDETVTGLADRLRENGARWVVALLHDGVTWWPATGGGTATRTLALQRATAPWARRFDAVLCGHTLGGWVGLLHGVPAGQALPLAAGVVVVDLPDHPDGAARVTAARVVPVDAGGPTGPVVARMRAAGRRIVGVAARPSSTLPDEVEGLARLVARATLAAGAADAAVVPASQLFTQAPIDGAVAGVASGPVSELDIHRLFPFPDDEPSVVSLRSGELDRLVRTHDALTDPANADADGEWWNWARGPAGVAVRDERARTVLVMPFFVPLVQAWLGRPVRAEPSGVSLRTALAGWFAT